MSQRQPIDLNQFQINPFDMIGKQWMLITAMKDGKVNTMTASWGGLGVLWNCNVAFIFVRDSRYTKAFIDGSESFSLTFFDNEAYKKTLGYLGTISGRDEDKIAKSGLTVCYEQGIPYFEEAKTVILCKKMSMHFIAREGFIDASIDERWYGDQDYHNMYVGEVMEILER
jgi:flavin reductase (DIM6/NTAB) family NADH-FMN oxidoreductase RutF